MSTSTGHGYLCKQCSHTLVKHKRGRCEDGACPCRVTAAPVASDDDATPVLVRVESTVQDQREEWMVEIAVRVRAAVVEGHVGHVLDICRSCYDAGYTARDRGGKGAV